MTEHLPTGRAGLWHAAVVGAMAVFAVSGAALAQGVSFEGETVESITASGVGGSGDAYLRYLQPYFSKHLPGNPTVTVNPISGGGGIIGTNSFVENASPDGTTYFLVPPSGRLTYLMDPDADTVRFDPAEWRAFLASPMGRVIYARPETGITSVEDLKDYDGQLIMALQAPTGSEMPTLFAIEALGLNVQTVFGLDGGEKALAYQRGELNLNTDVVSAWVTRGPELVAAGEAVPLFSFGYENEAGEIVRDPNFPDLPSWPEAYEIINGAKPDGVMWDAWLAMFRNAVMTSRILVLPGGTPDDVYQTYVDTAAAIIADPEFQATHGEFIGPYPLVTGVQAQRAHDGSLDFSDEAREHIVNWLRESHGLNL